MKIRGFTDGDIVPAAKLAFDAWHSELGGRPLEFQLFIYEYMVRFYSRSREYSFAVGEPETEAFLLAARRGDPDGSGTFFAGRMTEFAPELRKIAEAYREYLEANGRKVKEHMEPGDLSIGLFVSRRPGAGKALLARLKELGRSAGARNLFLWADVTCSHSYYSRNGFQEVEYFERSFPGNPPLGTMIFRKELQGEGS